jgi:hypothetical protein
VNFKGNNMDLEIGSVLLFCLATIGMTHIIVDGSILQGFRDFMQKALPEKLYEVFTCYQCLGFWCGLFVGYFILVRPCLLTDASWLTAIIWTFICGCASSFLSPWAAIYLNVLETKIVIEK